jgi:hypothetical protein
MRRIGILVRKNVGIVLYVDRVVGSIVGGVIGMGWTLSQ